MLDISVTDLAFILAFLEKKPRPKRSHLRALLCILTKKEKYFSQEEVGAFLKGEELERALESFHKKRLLEKEGCLYRKPEHDALAEMLSARR